MNLTRTLCLSTLVLTVLACSGAGSNDTTNAIDSEEPLDSALTAPAGDSSLATTADAGGDAGATSLVWHPGNYGLVATGNTAARDAFLTGALAGAFIGVEMVYPWADCEGNEGDYSACFAAMDADIAAVPTGKHIILFLQYKSFGSANAVPKYLRGSGPWCVTANGSPVCGQYATEAGAIAMIWNTAVAARMHAWFKAVATYYGPNGPGAARANRLAGIVLPETATGTNATIPISSVGYTAAKYVSAIEGNLKSLSTLFPRLPIFQYMNFLHDGQPSQSAALKSIADWALTQPNVGVGCPDVGGSSTFSPPGYDVLMNATYQGRLPFNVAIEPMDYDAPITTGLAATYAEATKKAPAGMAAQFVVWQHVKGAGHVFTIDDVGAYLPSHPDPNVALPTH